MNLSLGGGYSLWSQLAAPMWNLCPTSELGQRRLCPCSQPVITEVELAPYEWGRVEEESPRPLSHPCLGKGFHSMELGKMRNTVACPSRADTAAMNYELRKGSPVFLVPLLSGRASFSLTLWGKTGAALWVRGHRLSLLLLRFS